MTYQFQEQELQVIEYSKAFRDPVPVFAYPISKKEAWKSMALERKPLWLNTGVEVFNFYPDVIPDNRARGFINDGGKSIPDEAKGGKDMFGIEWVYMPSAGGSMEVPGVPHLFEDANDWQSSITWPDIDSWDWEGCSKRNQDFLNNGMFNYMVFFNGFGFERLISFMGFENAAMALLDEEQHDALKAMFDKMSDLYCRIVDRCCEYFDIDGFLTHDDWGTQLAPFFSMEVGRELFVPYMRKVTDHIHSKGKVAELHSCGCNERQIENYIAGGWDIWAPMANINDTCALFRKYGDQIIIGVSPEKYDKENDSEETIRAMGQKFARDFCSDPKKVCIVNRYFSPFMCGAYAEEVYRTSRQIYSGR